MYGRIPPKKLPGIRITAHTINMFNMFQEVKSLTM